MRVGLPALAALVVLVWVPSAGASFAGYHQEGDSTLGIAFYGGDVDNDVTVSGNGAPFIVFTDIFEIEVETPPCVSGTNPMTAVCDRNDPIFGGYYSGQTLVELGPGNDRAVADQSGFRPIISGRRGDDVIKATLDSTGIGADGGPGTDRLIGGPGDDGFKDFDGGTTIRGRGGRDRIRADGRSSPPDTIDCGPGIDKAYVNATDSVVNCEKVTVS